MGLVTSQSGGPGVYTSEIGANQAKVYQGVTKVGEVVAYADAIQKVGGLIMGFLILLLMAYLVYKNPGVTGARSAFTNIPRPHWQVPL